MLWILLREKLDMSLQYTAHYTAAFSRCITRVPDLEGYNETSGNHIKPTCPWSTGEIMLQISVQKSIAFRDENALPRMYKQLTV